MCEILEIILLQVGYDNPLLDWITSIIFYESIFSRDTKEGSVHTRHKKCRFLYMVGWRWHFSSLSALGSRQSSHSYSNSLDSGQVLYCSGPNRPSRKLFLWSLKVDVERGEIKYGNGISSFSLITMNAFSFIIEKRIRGKGDM